jgi:hypothetical protein
MIKMKKSDLAIAFIILAVVFAIFLAVFMSCQNAGYDEELDDETTDEGTNTGGIYGDGDGNIPIPHARILTLTTTGDTDTVVSAKTTSPPASTDWPNMRGREEAGAEREVERWQFVIDWRREGPKTEAQIKVALAELYAEWYRWKMKFDPLPYFSYIQGGDNQKYMGPNIDYSTGGNEIGTGTPVKLNQTDSLRINFVRYWPPASKVPSGLTKHLSVDAWNDTAKSLPPRIAAYNNVKADMEALIWDLEASPLYQDIKITVDGEEFAPIERIRNNLTELMRVGEEVVGPPTGNLSGFNWNSRDQIITINDIKSGRLYEAYFGFVPDGNGYAATKYTYPLH